MGRANRVLALFIASLLLALPFLGAVARAGGGAPNGLIYAIGGTSGTGALGTLEAYDTAQNCWSTQATCVPLAPMPTARNGLAAVYDPDTGLVYAIGGAASGSPVGATESYSPAGNAWLEVPPLPTPRSGLAAAYDPATGAVYAIGGENAGGVLATEEAYFPARNAWATVSPLVAPMPTARSGLAAVYDPQTGRIYAIGGTGAGGNALDTVEAYDPSTNSWSAVASMGTARSALAAVYDPQNGLIYAIGGVDAAGTTLATVEAYDPSLNSWSAVPSLGTARSGLAAAMGPNGLVYAIGGVSASGTELSLVESFDPLTNAPWTAVAALPTARSDLAAAVVPSGTAVTGATVTPASATAGASTSYTMDFDTSGSGALAGGSGTITIAPLSGQTLPTAVADWQVNGQQPSAVAPEGGGGASLTLAPSDSVGVSSPVAITVSDVTNPAAGAYAVTVATSADVEPVDAGYTIASAPALTAVSNLSVTPSPATPSAAATYTIAFTTGASGALAAGTGTIAIALPSGQTLPTSAADWRVNGTAPASVTASGGGGSPPILTLTLAASGGGIAASSPVTVTVSNVTNPVAGPYALTLATSADLGPVTATYTIGSGSSATAVSGLSVVPTPTTAGALASYAIDFTTSATGALGGGTGTITVGLSPGLSLPSAAADWTVNGNAPASVTPAGGSGVPETLTLTLAASHGILASSAVAISVANATNPAAGSYTLSLATSADLGPATATYTIGSGSSATAVSGLSVVPTPTTAGALASYAIDFTTSATGALGGGTGTITVALSPGLSLPSAAADWTVNGYAPASVTPAGGSGVPETLTLTLAANHGIAASSAVATSVANATNPAAGSYTLSLATSADSQPASASYTIGGGSSATTVSGLGVVPTPATAGASASYAITFTTSASGALTGGAGTITITPPLGSTLPTTASDWQVNGIGPSSVVSAGGGGLTLTVPASLPASGQVTVDASNVQNPALAGAYSLTVATSADTQAASASYTITAASAADGSGTMQVAPLSLVADSTGQTLTFTYTAAAGGIANGTVDLAVPGGWPAPSTSTGAEGYTTASTGVVSVVGQTISVANVTLAGGQALTVVYGDTGPGGPGLTAPAAVGSVTFAASEASTASGTLTPLLASPAVAVTVGSATKLVFSTEPAGAAAGSALATQPVVTVEDQAGNTVANSGASITLSIASGTGAAGANLACTADPVSASAGVATFSGCSIDTAGTGYVLTASAAGLTSATSTAFAVTGGALAIATGATLGEATTGTPYSLQMQATGGSGHYSWSVTGTTQFPGGLTLSPSGLLSGTPDLADAGDLVAPVVEVTDTQTAQTATLQVFLRVVGSSVENPAVQLSSHVQGATGVTYTATFTTSAVGAITSTGPFGLAVTLTAPTGTTFPSPASDYSVQAGAASVAIATVSALPANSATIYLSGSGTVVPASTAVTVTVTGVANPPVASGADQLQVWTAGDPGTATTADYTISPVVLPSALADSTITASPNPILFDTTGGGGSVPQTSVVVDLLDSAGGGVPAKTVALAAYGSSLGYPWNVSPASMATGVDGKATFSVSLQGGYGASGSVLVGATDTTDGQFIGGLAIPAYFYNLSFAGGEYSGVSESVQGTGLPPSAAVTQATFGGSPLSLSTPCATDATGSLPACYFTVPSGTVGQSYPLVLTIDGLAFSQGFTIAPNPAGTPASIAVVSGDSQSTVVGTAFASPLSAKVEDGLGNPVAGATVTFTIQPSSQGAGATFPGGVTRVQAQTLANGIATSSALTANSTIGSYTVGASAAGTSLVSFTLNNTAGAPAAIAATQGDGQEAVSGQAFGQVLAATVTDAAGNPVPNVQVTFTAPATGATGTFANGQHSDTVPTDGNGIAWSQAFTAGPQTGAFTVTASVQGLSATASFGFQDATAVLQTCDAQSLQSAFAAGGYVVFACAGTIQLSQTLTVPSGLKVTLVAQAQTVALEAPPTPTFGSTQAALDTGWTDRVFDVEGGNLTLVGLTIIGGDVQAAAGQNGAAGAPGASGQDGLGTAGLDGTAGAAGAAGGVARGGAMYIAAGSQVTIVDSLFSGNEAIGGAGGTGGAGGAGGVGGGGGGPAGTPTPAGPGGNGGLGGSGGQGGDAQGGAVYNLGTLTLTNVDFFSNQALGGEGGYGDVGGAGGQGGLGAPGQTGPAGASTTCASAGVGGVGYAGGAGAPGGVGAASGSGAAGGTGAGGAVYSLGTLVVTGGDVEGNLARGGYGGGQLNGGLNDGGIGGQGGSGGDGGKGGDVNLPKTGCAKGAGSPGKGGTGGAGGASGDSGAGGFGGAGGTGGGAQGGAIWDAGAMSLSTTTFGGSRSGGNQAVGGTGGTGGNGGSAADGLNTLGGGGGVGGGTCQSEVVGPSIGDVCVAPYGGAGKSGTKGLKSFGGAGGWGGPGGDGGGAQGGALYVSQTAQTPVESGLVYGSQNGASSDANLATGGQGGQGGQGGYSKCLVTGQGGGEGFICTWQTGSAKQVPSVGPGSAGVGSGAEGFVSGQANAPLAITTTSLPGGIAGTSYYLAWLQATDGVGPYTWSVQGSLPPGLALDPQTGMISDTGTTVAGMYFFTVEVSDGETPAETATADLSIDIVPAAAGDLTSVSPVSGSSNASSDTPSGSATAGGAGSDTPDTAATASGGTGTVAVTDYAVDPVGAPSFQSSGQYFDVAVSTPAQGGFSSVTATKCNVAAGDTVEWSPDGSTWQAVTPQSYDATTGCITLGPFDANSSPTLAELTGTVFGVAAPTVTVGAGDSLSFSPSTLAAQGSLNPGDTASTTLSVQTGSGAALSGATVYLSLAPSAAGAAVAEGVRLTGTPEPFTTNGQGQITVTYTAPASLPPSGVESVVAQSDLGSPPAVETSASYDFAPPVQVPAAVTLTASPTQVGANQTALLSGHVYDRSGSPIQNAVVDLSASAGTLSAVQVTTLADGSYSADWTSPLVGGATISVSVEGGATAVTAQVDVSGAAATATGPPQTGSAPALAIATAFLAAGQVGKAYAERLTAIGGVAPYTWSAASAGLPPGLHLDPSGLLSGTPTKPGPFTLAVTVEDAQGATATSALSLAVSAPGLVIATRSLGDARVGVAYRAGLVARNGTPPVTWTVQSGALPLGLSLDAATGVVSGTPRVAGRRFFDLAVTDANGVVAIRGFTLDVLPSALRATGVLPGAQAQSTYAAGLAVQGGTRPYTWRAVLALPAGLRLNAADGLLYGVPSHAGIYRLSLVVTDSSRPRESAAVVYTLSVSAPQAVSVTWAATGAAAVQGEHGSLRLHLANLTDRSESLAIAVADLTLAGVPVPGAVRFGAVRAVTLGPREGRWLVLAYTASRRATPGVYTVTLVVEPRGGAARRLPLRLTLSAAGR